MTGLRRAVITVNYHRARREQGSVAPPGLLQSPASIEEFCPAQVHQQEYCRPPADFGSQIPDVRDRVLPWLASTANGPLLRS